MSFIFTLFLWGGNGYERKLILKDSFALYPVAVWRLTENLELKVGRSFYDSYFQEIISSNDFEPFLFSFDGLSLNYQVQNFEAFIFASVRDYPVFEKKIETKRWPLSLGFLLNMESLSSFIDKFNIYATVLSDQFFSPQAQNMFRGGLGVKGRAPLINLTGSFVFSGHGKGLEFSLNEETMYHAEIKKSFPLFFDSSLFAGFHTDSSGYKAWAYNRHEHAGLMDIFLWGNLTYYFLGFDLESFLADLRVQALELKPTDPKKPLHFSWAGEFIDQKRGGYELDIELSRDVGKNLEFRMLTSFFIPKTGDKNWLKRDISKSLKLHASYLF